jgi:hypothetical protein
MSFNDGVVDGDPDQTIQEGIMEGYLVEDNGNKFPLSCKCCGLKYLSR